MPQVSLQKTCDLGATEFVQKISPIQEPTIFSGHTSNIKKCIFLDNSTKVLSTSDDKTLKVWDTKSGGQISSLSFEHTPSSIEVSRDGKLLILSEGKNVELYDSASFSKLNTFTVPCGVTAAAIHPDNGTFVCADENFTLYKYSIASGAVLGKSASSTLAFSSFDAAHIFVFSIRTMF